MGFLLAPYRHSMFLPSDIANLAGWYHGSFTGVAADAAVSSWVDLSGNSRNALQATGAFQPIHKANIVNGRSVVRFDGTNDHLRTASFTTLAQPNTVFVLSKLSGLPAVLSAMVDGSTALSALLYADASPANFRMYAGVLEVSGGATDTTNWHVHCAVFNGASSKIRADGGAGSAATNAGAGGYAAFTIGANGGLSDNFWNGDIAEICIYNRALTVAEINQVGQYLADTAAITWTTAT